MTVDVSEPWHNRRASAALSQTRIPPLGTIRLRKARLSTAATELFCRLLARWGHRVAEAVVTEDGADFLEGLFPFGIRREEVAR